MLSPIAPLESPYVQASRAVRRTVAADAATTMAAQRAAHEAAMANAVTAPVQTHAAPPINQDLLRDQYADERMHRAVEQHQPMSADYDSGHWGSVDALLPYQPYRVSQANPPIESFGVMLASTLRRLDVPRVENAGLDDGFESARQRRRAANWP